MPARSCVFCSIVRGETPAFVVLDEPDVLAFLDSRPLFPGHCLLIPRAHHEVLTDLPAALVGPLFATAQRLARAVESALSADGFFVAINNRVSQSVPHLHVHVVPRRQKDGLKGFFWPRYKYSGEQQMHDTRDAIVTALTPG
ncbi:HIT family protein [Sorangium sp. So ce233]|uniref:HIT family protein n=1 Tax=Sorangium sp. So ce233 TaxID=3133290 RepID=UPI003F5F4FAC